MNVKDLVTKTRSYRRFYHDHSVTEHELRELVELARLSASASNSQPLKFIISADNEKNKKIFPHLKWAGYIKNWEHPIPAERPSAYIIVLGDTNIRKSIGCDHGVASQSILLGATEKGLGGCMFGSVDRKNLRKELNIPEHLEILLAIALGKPKETVQLEKVGKDGEIKYWRDKNQVHHVPKRSLDEIILQD